jgi:TonB family protein
MKTLNIALNPRAWVQSWTLALRNSFAGLLQILRNPRLWIGIGASLLVHGAIILLSLEYNKAIPEDQDGIWELVVTPGTEHPNVTKFLEPSGTTPGTEEAVNRPVKSSAADELQALTENTIDPTDLSAVESHGVIIITNKQASSEALLGLEPITGIRSKGGIVLPGIIPLEGPIDPTGRTIFEPAIEKPVGESHPTNTSDVKEPTSGKGTKFSLEGDLSPSDIVSATMPRYPDFARAKGLTNVVIVIDFTANQRGDVASTMVIRRSTGYPQWDEAVKATLKSWKFVSSDAFQRNGRITFKFVLTT